MKEERITPEHVSCLAALILEKKNSFQTDFHCLSLTRYLLECTEWSREAEGDAQQSGRFGFMASSTCFAFGLHSWPWSACDILIVGFYFCCTERILTGPEHLIEVITLYCVDEMRLCFWDRWTCSVVLKKTSTYHCFSLYHQKSNFPQNDHCSPVTEQLLFVTCRRTHYRLVYPVISQFYSRKCKVRMLPLVRLTCW